MKGKTKQTTDGEKHTLSDTEIAGIEQTEHPARTAAMIMTFAGLRRGELIALQWSDIDLEAATITVSKSVRQNGDCFTVTPAKTVTRVVGIPEKLIHYLTPLKQPGSSLVCPCANNEMHSVTTWKLMWDSYMSELYRFNTYAETPGAIEDITPQMLRHSFQNSMITLET